METDTSVVMDAFIGQGDFSAIAAHCESALLDVCTWVLYSKLTRA